MQMRSKVQQARTYAIEKHAEQMYGEHPYVYHLDAVYAIVVEMDLGEDYEIAAYLHDVLEDTTTQRKELIELFGSHIANMVFAVSGFGATREDRNKNIKEKMELYPSSINLKMCDRLANVRSSKIHKVKLFKTYQKEHLILKHIFEKGLPQLFLAIEEAIELDVSIKLSVASCN